MIKFMAPQIYSISIRVFVGSVCAHKIFKQADRHGMQKKQKQINKTPKAIMTRIPRNSVTE